MCTRVCVVWYSGINISIYIIYICIYVCADTKMNFLRFLIWWFLWRVRIDPANYLVNVSGFEWCGWARIATARIVYLFDALATLNTIDFDKLHFKRSQVLELERLVAVGQKTFAARRLLVSALESRRSNLA